MASSGLTAKVKFLLYFIVITGLVVLGVIFYETGDSSSSRWKWKAQTGCEGQKLQSCNECGAITSVAGNLNRPSQVQFVHQSWKTENLPSRFQKWSSSWKACFPKAHYILWTDKTNRQFIADYYPWFLERYDKLPSAIYRADSVRYLYLFHYGGIYTDLDNECLKPFHNLLLNSTIVFGAMSGYKNVREGYVQNSFMYSAPRHPLWLELILQIIRTTSNNHAPENLTGPGALVKVINAYRKRMKSTDDITVYPPDYFNPFSWQTNKVKACKHFNLMTNEEMIKCREAFMNTSYVVQYHTHTWGGGKIL